MRIFLPALKNALQKVRRLFCALKRTEEKGKFGKWNGCRNISGMRNQWRQFRFILRMASEIFGHGQKLPHFIENVCHVHSALLHWTNCNISRRSSVKTVTTIVGISAVSFKDNQFWFWGWLVRFLATGNSCLISLKMCAMFTPLHYTTTLPLIYMYLIF